MKVQVRERATGQVMTVWPVDARELLASGEYEPADGVAERIAAGKPAFPMAPTAQPTVPTPAATGAAVLPPSETSTSAGAFLGGVTSTPPTPAEAKAKRGKK